MRNFLSWLLGRNYPAVFAALTIGCLWISAATGESIYLETFNLPAAGQESNATALGKFTGEDLDRSGDYPPGFSIVAESPFSAVKSVAADAPKSGVMQVSSGGLLVKLADPFQDSFWFTFQMARLSPAGYCYFALQNQTGHNLIVVGDNHVDKLTGITLSGPGVEIVAGPEVPITADTPSLFVGYYDSPTNTTKLWIDPPVGGVAPDPSTAYLTTRPSEAPAKDYEKPPFGRIGITATANAQAVFDEIHIARTWEERWK